MLSLYDVDLHAFASRSKTADPEGLTRTNSAVDGRAGCSTAISAKPTMVEPDGIEPTTSCLQSTRSPN